MRIFTRRMERLFSIIISFLLIVQPLNLHLKADTLKIESGGEHYPKQGNRDGIDISKDNIPVININRPNSKGISYNTYNNFNVNEKGLILNNSAVNVNTQLASWIEGNSNLRINGEAKLILNEVVSNNKSQIDGIVEIAGKKADVIIANPNGISLNGAGFINTNRLTLTTGIPVFKDGNLDKFIVRQGDISFYGNNSFLEQDRLDIISQTLQIYNKIQANKLNIILGNNDVEANSLDIKNSVLDEFLNLDTSNLGGMYANTISLKATQKGVGVNMQGELLSEEDFILDVNGNISLNRANLQSSSSNVYIKSNEDILIDSSLISANSNLNVVSKNLELNSSNLSSVDSINLQIDESLKNINNSAIVSENSNININSNLVLNDNSKIISGNSIDLKLEEFKNIDSLVFAINDVSITNKDNTRATTIINKHSDIVAFNGDLTLKAQEVINQGKAPTYIKDGYVATWYELASSTSKDIFKNTLKLLKDDVKDINNSVKKEYYQAYLDLLSSLMKNSSLNEKSKEIIKDTLIDVDGKIEANMIGTWIQLSGKATQVGISDYDLHLKTLLKDDIQNIDGSIKDEYLENYISLWEKSISGEELLKYELDILNDDIKDENGNIKSSINSIWKSIRVVSGASYEIKKSLIADVLNNDGKLAQLISGKSINIDTQSLINKYANISANENVKIISDTFIENSSYGASQMLHEVHKTSCFTCHSGSIGFRELFGGIIEAKGNVNLVANSLVNKVTSTSNKTLNLPRLDEFHDLRNKYLPVPKSYVVLKDVKNRAVTKEEKESLIAVKTNAIDSKYVKESFIDYDKYIDTTSNTHYGEFLSSSYMMKRLKYFPEYESRLNSSRWALNIASQGENSIYGKNVSLNIKDKIVLESGITAQEDLIILSNGDLTSTSQLISGNDTNISVAKLNQIGGGIKAKNLNINTEQDLNLVGTKVRVDENILLSSKEDINLSSQRLVTSGKRGDINWINSKDIGTSIQAKGYINLNSNNSINLEASNVESLNSSVMLNANNEINIFAGENYQEFSWVKSSSKRSGLKKKTTTTNHKEEHLTNISSVIKAKDNITLNSINNINIKGSSLLSRDGNIDLTTQGDVNILAVKDKHLVEHSSKTSKSFIGIKYGSNKSTSTAKSTITQGSISEAMGDISSKANGITTLQASKLNANGNITINSSKGIQILSGKDSYEYEYENKDSKLGSLLTKEQKDILNQAKIVSSLINANDINLITNDGITLQGSQIQANTVNMMAQYLALISSKNSEQYSSFSDNSGLILRTIINQGYVKEEIVPSVINANEINLNGKKLLEDSLNADNLLKQISSEYELNDEQIIQIKAELNNKQWYDKTTTLSKMGMIIIQVVVTVLTMGAGATILGALNSAMQGAISSSINATVQSMISATISSITSQLTSALVSSVITGNKLDLNVEKILINSMKAAALAGLIEQIDTNLGYATTTSETLSYANKVSQQILHGFAKATVYGIDIETALLNSLGNVAFEYVGHELYSPNSAYSIQDYVPKTAIHSIIGGTLAKLSGGDFSQGAIATAVSHSVGEFIEKTLLNKAIVGELSNERAKEIIKAISSVVSGAVVLATHENVTDKELEIAKSMGESVVINNALKNFDDKVEFGKGLLEVVGTELLDILELVINNPNEVLENLSDLITTLENFDINNLDIEGYIKDTLTPEIADNLIAKLKNINSAISNNDIEYKGIEANQAGKDLGEVIATLSGFVGAKGLTKALKSSKADDVVEFLTHKTYNGKTANQLNKLVKTGKAPSGLGRIDTGKVKGEQLHIVIIDSKGKEHALNVDGTWKHGGVELTKKQKDWLINNGFKL